MLGLITIMAIPTFIFLIHVRIWPVSPGTDQQNHLPQNLPEPVFAGILTSHPDNVSLQKSWEYTCHWFARILIMLLSIIIGSRKSNINYRPQTFSVFNGKPKEPEKT